MAMCAGKLALAVEVPPAFDEHLGLPLLANHFRISGSLSDSPLELLTILNGEFIAHSVKPCPELRGVNAPLSLAATVAHRLLSRRAPVNELAVIAVAHVRDIVRVPVVIAHAKT